MKNSRVKSTRNRIFYTVLAVFMVCIVFLFMARYVYMQAENDAYEMLHVDTSEIKEDLNLQMISDRENLYTIASVAAKLYSDGQSYDLLFESFEPIGLIQNIGIFQSDNTFHTKNGQVEVPRTELMYEQECEKEAYISGRVSDMTHPEHKIIRSAVPVVVNGETVAILYGMIELSALNEKYEAYAEERNADLYVFERGNGNILIDTLHDDADNVSTFKMSNYKRGFSYDMIMTDLRAGNSGYSAFVSGTTGEYFYAHYAPMKIGDWQIMLSKPERIVFEESHSMMSTLIMMFVFAVVIMVLYMLLLLAGETRQSRLNFRASHIRKILLGINQTSNGLYIALENMTDFSKARSSFFADTDGEDYHYINPSAAHRLLEGAEKKAFILEIFSYAGRKRANKNESVIMLNIVANGKLRKEEPRLYNILNRNKIKRVCCVAISEKRNLVSVLGVINPRKVGVVCELLADISVCCSMAVYNKKYLNNTEVIAMTDALTGVYNRLQFKKDVEEFDELKPQNFVCIYIDVNELHTINSKYGHATGDTMLLYIAKSLKETFSYGKIYRMGGDEFLVFSTGLGVDRINSDAEKFINKIEAMNYHVSVGISYAEKNTDTEIVVKTAEDHMYKAKAEYYLQKEHSVDWQIAHPEVLVSTGVPYVDASLGVLIKHYNAVMMVSLNSGEVKRIILPENLKRYFEDQTDFKKAMRNYIDEFVNSDDKRSLENFLHYDAIKRQLELGNVPTITYTNNAGEKINLSVSAVDDKQADLNETLWTFERLSR